MDARQKIEEMPPLPIKARKFFCTKCASVTCASDTERDTNPLCAECGYLGIGGDAPLSDEQIHDYARKYAAQTLASKEAEIARLKSGQAASLTDDQINDLWIRRDCIEAIQAGDISAQVRCVVRAALKQPTE